MTELHGEKKRKVAAGDTLYSNAAEVEALLIARKPKAVPGLTADMHILPPFLPKVRWSELGDLLKANEAEPRGAIDGSKWITMRLDGNGFSRYTKYLKRHGIIDDGYSTAFGEVMQECCKAVLEKFSGWAGYTQSDEMSIVVAPASVVRGEQMPHPYRGRTQKLASLAASYCAGVFNHRVMTIWNEKKGTPMPLDAFAVFDCRVAAYDTGLEACSLLWWRAYDSGINGVTDACFHQRGKLPGAKEAVTKGNDEKLQWLLSHNLLPLSPHQAYGSFFKKARVEHTGVNPLTGETVTTLRSKTFREEGCLLTMFATGKLNYTDLPRREDTKPAAPGHAAVPAPSPTQT